jgi:hypothetical protein
LNLDQMSATAPAPVAPARPAYRGRLRGALRNSFTDGVLSSFAAAVVDNVAVAAILARVVRVKLGAVAAETCDIR